MGREAWHTAGMPLIFVDVLEQEERHQSTSEQVVAGRERSPWESAAKGFSYSWMGCLHPWPWEQNVSLCAGVGCQHLCFSL